MTPVIIVLLTYARTEYALRTIAAARRHLIYAGDLWWYVADDGSEAEHYGTVVNALDGAIIIGQHSERIGYGHSANVAWQTALTYSAFSLWLEDDWELRGPLDLEPYVKVLQDQHDVGIVRLAYLPIGLDCHTLGYDGRLYLKMLRSTQYAFSGNPSLRHRRYLEAYGQYPTGRNPGDTEIAYDEQFRAKTQGPEIIWPLELGTWGAFGHIGERKSYA